MGLDVVILCGGRGTRAYPETVDLPKPLLPIGDRPILDHVMDVYEQQGHARFVLSVGYLGGLIRDRYGSGRGGSEVVVVDTGEDTPTGERIRLVADHLRTERFFATYGDGLGDVDLVALERFHADHTGAATVTTVPLPSQYGTIEADGAGRVVQFREKPRLPDHWINAGFFVFDRRVFDAWDGVDLEQQVLPALGDRGELYAYRHEGFWKSMDTFKDRQELTRLAEGGDPPWGQPR